MGRLRFVLTRDAREFRARTERLLSARLECNILATVLMNVLQGLHCDPLFAYGLAETGDEVAFAALRTPPWPLLASPLAGADADELVELWLREDPDVPGVSGVPETTGAIGAAWARLTGGVTRRTMSEGMHVLEEVRDPPRPAGGTLRAGHDGERELLVGWIREFALETGLHGAAQAEAMVDAHLRRGTLRVWDDGGPASVIGVHPEIAGVVRIGPVYTPPPLRRRGYAGSAVAAASRRALGAGARRCMLFTDLANPTSNKIYAEVGYRRIADWEEIALEPPPRAGEARA